MLNISSVIFDGVVHAYWFNGYELTGITTVLGEMIFWEKFKGIPPAILHRAAAKGSRIHAGCQTYDMFGQNETEYKEVDNYGKLKREHDIRTIENEYLVSDEEHFATQIDVVGSVGSIPKNQVDLFDIKTTYQLDTEYLSWQLSCCAYLFELQNPRLKVRDLYGIWLRGDVYELRQVDKIDPSIIKELFNAYLNDTEFINPRKKEILKIESEEKLVLLEQSIVELKAEIDHYESLKEEILKNLLSQMEQSDMKKWETDRVIVTRVLPTTSKTFDAKTFKEKYPDLAAQFEKETTKKGYLKITLKK